jgi:hypothetical protein
MKQISELLTAIYFTAIGVSVMAYRVKDKVKSIKKEYLETIAALSIGYCIYHLIKYY